MDDTCIQHCSLLQCGVCCIASALLGTLQQMDPVGMRFHCQDLELWRGRYGHPRNKQYRWLFGTISSPLCCRLDSNFKGYP
jgi:hypothetical protein